MKTKNNIVFLKFLSVMLGLYFLNISINFYSFFGFAPLSVSTELGSYDNSAATYVVQGGFDTSNLPADTNSGTSNNPPAEEEEEEKKGVHDDFFTPHGKYSKNADEQYIQRFHGVHNTKEFISEIIPPPPKA